MEFKRAQSTQAVEAYELVTDLQSRLVAKLSAIAVSSASSVGFQPHKWLRANGQNGGGIRFAVSNHPYFNAASVNVSQVHYETNPDKALGSATALSTIIHPVNPHCPSMHMHISWTEMKSGHAYWRIMADLNPAVIHDEAKYTFEACIRSATLTLYDRGKEQGEKYFYIPALGRHRGVAHFYLEEFSTGDYQSDRQLAKSFGEAVCDCYAAIVAKAAEDFKTISHDDRKVQLSYHTLYFLQVLTLDRGTISGLLVHDENDLGILASLPSKIDRDLLVSWGSLLSPPQTILFEGILKALPMQRPYLIDDGVKKALAAALRKFYTDYPEALKDLARGDVVPATVDNHQ